jgi:hypothetical protein
MYPNNPQKPGAECILVHLAFSGGSYKMRYAFETSEGVFTIMHGNASDPERK